MRNLLEFRDKYPKDLFSAHVLPDSTDVRIIAETNPEEWERYCTSVVDKERHEIEEGFHGCCIGIPRDLLNAVGLFDEGFYKVAWEDVDYCHRVFKAGRKTQITHSSVIWHYGGVTQSYIGTREGHGHVHQNRMYFEKKWGIDTSNGICNRSIIWTRGKVGWEKVTCK
jgi:GT2 family glycosyltransferase